MPDFKMRALPGVKPEMTPRQRVTGLQKVRALVCDLSVEEMHARDVAAVLEVVDRHIMDLERTERDDREDAEAEFMSHPPRRRSERSPYVLPNEYVELLVKIPAAADRLHAAWEAGVVPDYIGRGGRENVLRHGEALAKGIMRKAEVVRLEKWVEVIDNAYARIPQRPSSP